MRLKPPVSEDEAIGFLSHAAKLSWGDGAADELAPLLAGIARSMATLSAIEIPDEIEPLFGEDSAQDAVA